MMSLFLMLIPLSLYLPALWSALALPKLPPPPGPHRGQVVLVVRPVLGVGVRLIVHLLLVTLRHQGDLVLGEVHVVVHSAALSYKISMLIYFFYFLSFYYIPYVVIIK